MPTRTEIRGNTAFWLLEFRVGGQPFRFSTGAVDVPTEAGEILHFREGLQDFTWQLSKAGIENSIGLELRVDVDWAAMVARGIPLERAPGVLYRFFEGQTIERARVIVRGLVERVEYGATAEPLVFSLSTLPNEQSQSIPSVSAVVSAETWPILLDLFDEKIGGSPYPTILGAPGGPQGGGGAPASPGLMVDLRANNRNSRIMIAGHRVNATEVRLHNLTANGISDTRAVFETQDLLGRTVSCVNLLAPTPLSPDADQKWYVGWDVNQGGIPNEAGTGPLRGAGELIRFLLERFTSIPIDRGRMQAQTAALDAYKIDGFVNRPIKVWDFITKEIAPLLPVILRQTSNGLYFQFINWSATALDAVARLDTENGEIDRISPVKTGANGVFNEISIEYAPFATSTRYGQRRVISAKTGVLSQDQTLETDTRILGDYRCDISQRKFVIKHWISKI